MAGPDFDPDGEVEVGVLAEEGAEAAVGGAPEDGVEVPD